MTEQPKSEANCHTPDECHRYHVELHAAAGTLRCETFSEASTKARLWNAAPDLLAACEAVVNFEEQSFKLCRAAVAKAKEPPDDRA